jgi:outer membrane protein OmpA-like peptidoglycan-associated protein
MNDKHRKVGAALAALLAIGLAPTLTAHAQEKSSCALSASGEVVDFSGCAVGDTVVLYGIHFEFDKSELTLDARTLLGQVAEALIQRPDIKVEIAGHTDSRGSDAYNQKLSAERTVSVMNYLASRGVAMARMRAVGYGETQPVAGNDTDEGRARNRRVELRMTEARSQPTPAPVAVAPPAPTPPPALVYDATPIPKGLYDDGKVFLTGGVFTVDGAGGGGAVPWATITGYETRDGINGGAGFTYANLPALQLTVFGAAVGFFDRFELSYAKHDLSLNLSNLDTAALAAESAGLDLGTNPWNTTIQMDVIGAKLRLFGDAVYTSDSWIPQVAVGGLWKKNGNEELVHTLGAAEAKDWEAYVAATKVFFRYSTLVNVTARYTSANQIGLTGFGSCDEDGNCENKKEVRFEASVAHLVAKNTAIGFEYQQHGDNLDGRSVNLGGLDLSGLTDLIGGGLASSLEQRKESDWWDIFFAYAPNKKISFVIAYLMLGNISVSPDNNGFYFSTHLTF